MRMALCHPDRRYHARDLCSRCYNKQKRDTDPAYRQRAAENTRRWVAANREKMLVYYRARSKLVPSATRRERTLRSEYGIGHVDYLRMLEEQGGGCALCKRLPGKRYFHVDHSHTTGKVRGVLCHQCNWYLGKIDKDSELLARIAAYLERA